MHILVTLYNQVKCIGLEQVFFQINNTNNLLLGMMFEDFDPYKDIGEAWTLKLSPHVPERILL